MCCSGKIFAIEEFSTFDGPGIRTTVFLKGCPLRCMWCHNPEGQSFQSEIIKNTNGCIGCGRCLDIGEKCTGKRQIVEESVHVCPQNLIRNCGVDYAPQLMVEKLLKNAAVLNSSGGGVTFSGGEPLAQPDFLLECLIKLNGQTNRALQTSGYCDEMVFLDILQHLDYVLFDLKIVDEEKHAEYTGRSNKEIIHNFEALCSSGKKFCVRIPLIPTVTDTIENITAIAALMRESNAAYAELLPYNKMAGGKYAMAGKSYRPTFDEQKEVEIHRNIFEQNGISIKIV
jgi:pyruvate formate lyase activating enzyme